jgi:hypothetical protein
MTALDVGVGEAKTHLVEGQGAEGRAGCGEGKESGTDVVEITWKGRGLAGYGAAGTKGMLLQDESPESGLGQNTGRHQAVGSRADDDGVGIGMAQWSSFHSDSQAI